MIRLVIPGDPVPWQAPTFSRNKIYDKKYKVKNAIVLYLKYCINNQALKDIPISSTVRMDVYFEMPIPKSWSKKKRAEFDLNWELGLKEWHPKKPDRTNCLKLIEDCLQRAGILSNDSLVTSGETQKYYSPSPKTIVVIQTEDI